MLMCLNYKYLKDQQAKQHTTWNDTLQGCAFLLFVNLKRQTPEADFGVHVVLLVYILIATRKRQAQKRLATLDIDSDQEVLDMYKMCKLFILKYNQAMNHKIVLFIPMVLIHKY